MWFLYLKPFFLANMKILINHAQLRGRWDFFCRSKKLLLLSCLEDSTNEVWLSSLALYVLSVWKHSGVKWWKSVFRFENSPLSCCWSSFHPVSQLTLQRCCPWEPISFCAVPGCRRLRWGLSWWRSLCISKPRLPFFRVPSCSGKRAVISCSFCRSGEHYEGCDGGLASKTSSIIRFLLKELEDHYQTAKADMMLAARTKPIHGENQNLSFWWMFLKFIAVPF